MGAGGLALENRGLCGLDGDALDRGLLLLEEAGGARNGTAGANAGHDEVDSAFGVRPDLGAGGLVVGLRVRGVHELSCHDGTRGLLAKLLGLGDGALHAVLARRKDDLRAVGRGELAALDGHGLGHDEDHLVAARGCKHGKANAGVARRGLDHGAARLETTVLLGCVEHCAGNAVLDGAAGVGGLVLAVDGCCAIYESRKVYQGG